MKSFWKRQRALDMRDKNVAWHADFAKNALAFPFSRGDASTDKMLEKSTV